MLSTPEYGLIIGHGKRHILLHWLIGYGLYFDVSTTSKYLICTRTIV
jgi:hypothetical protein